MRNLGCAFCEKIKCECSKWSFKLQCAGCKKVFDRGQNLPGYSIPCFPLDKMKFCTECQKIMLTKLIVKKLKDGKPEEIKFTWT